MHWDMTSFSLHGAYPDTDGDYPAPSYGHPKDRREDLLQIQAGIAAAGDGGIPVFTHAYSGGAAEISQVIGAMNGLKKIAGTKKFLLVGDSKLISYDNVAAIGGAGWHVPGPRVQALRQGRRAGRLRPGQGHRGRLRCRTRPAQEEHQPRKAGPLVRPGRRSAVLDPQLQTQKRPADPAAPHLRALQCPRRRRPHQPHQEAHPRQRRPGPPGVGPGRPVLPRRAEGRRPHQADQPRPQGRPLPALQHRHRPGRAAPAIPAPAR